VINYLARVQYSVVFFEYDKQSKALRDLGLSFVLTMEGLKGWFWFGVELVVTVKNMYERFCDAFGWKWSWIVVITSLK